ncbi:uncharacterized protein LOC112846434 [Oreochromis niloticus]|uniref:uncharacterized protein LOC112846434 n=1 Tax=Oreochromis niloticus TaxID=8128 RepID=UPI000DF32251|nr:uncharacterized protein LOC112846434 [Oreochromis niloticus]
MGSCSLTTWISLFVVVVVPSAVVSGQEIITAKSGQDNITLPCQAPNNKTTHVEWRRTDLWKEYVLLYRDGHLYPDNQHPSFKNRVDLQDRQMKDGDVSLILNNVTTADSGTYECRVFMEDTRSWKSISIIYLRVDPPGQTGGDTEDGGKEAGGTEGEGKEAGGKESEGKNAEFDLLTVGLLVAAVLFFAFVFFLIYRKYKAQQKQVSYKPPIQIQPV